MIADDSSNVKCRAWFERADFPPKILSIHNLWLILPCISFAEVRYGLVGGDAYIIKAFIYAYS